jgi:hypothetical protein
MDVERYEWLIQIEAEQLAETLFDTAYFDLPPDLRLWVRVRAIESLSTELTPGDFRAAA